MNVKIEVITPEIAKEYLARNTSNYRKVNHKRVASYAKDMELGKWEFNGEGIKFSKSGNLVDGQHRLAAIVKANVPVKMLVIYDVDDDVKIYDVAQSRTISQIARASGMSGEIGNSSVLSAASTILSVSWDTSSVPKGRVINYVSENSEEFSEAIKISRQGTNHGIAKKSACIAAIYCMLRLGKCKNSLIPFFGVVNSGFPVDGYDCSPAIVFRNYLIKSDYNKLRTNYKFKTIFSITIQALYDFDNGKARRQSYKPDFDLADRIRNSVMEMDEA